MVARRPVACACWEVTGSRDVELLLAQARKENPSLVVQAFTAAVEPNLAAVEMVAAQTLAARDTGTTLAERPELDLLLRLAGTRQIGQALQSTGYKARGRRLFLVAAGRRAADFARLKRMARLGGFREVPRSALSAADLESVERAALLSAKA